MQRRPCDMRTDGYVYFANCDGKGVKVGFSKNPHERVRRFFRSQNWSRPIVYFIEIIGFVPGSIVDE
jgi:hypothetical protein